LISGTIVDYPPSPLVIKSIPTVKITSKQQLATNIPLGMRFPSYQVLSQAGSRPWPLQVRLLSDGRFRVLIFGGDIAQPASLSRVNKLGSYLQDELLPQYTYKDGKKPTALNCIIDVLLVHCAPRASIELLRDLHDVYHPFDEEFGYDYDKVFEDEVSYGGVDGKAYENYGVSKERGCVVIVRPDQYVSHILDLEDEKEIEAFFGGILVPHHKEPVETLTL
jgi:phenol 2-monooxygenase